MNMRTLATLVIGVIAVGSAAHAAMTRSRTVPDVSPRTSPDAGAAKPRSGVGRADEDAEKPVLVDTGKVRLPSGKVVSIGPGLTEFRSNDQGVVTRFRREGADVEYGWRADQSAPSPRSAVWGSAWSVRTAPGVRVGVESGGTVLTFPHGVAKLAAPMAMLIQDRDQFFITVRSKDPQNVYCYDDRGRRLWQIGKTPPGLITKAFAAIDVAADGTLTAMNTRPFTARVDRKTGAILTIHEGQW